MLTGDSLSRSSSVIFDKEIPPQSKFGVSEISGNSLNVGVNMDDQPDFKRSKVSEKLTLNDEVDLEPNLLESSVTLIHGSSSPMKVESIQAEQINTEEDSKFPSRVGIDDSDTSSISNPTEQMNGVGNKLCEHELFVIFKNSCLNTNDLLRCRQVNRIWRDAATSVLTKRNQCQLMLTVKNVERANSNEMDYEDYVKIYCNARKPETLLKDLVELIPTSTEFPATRLCFLNSYAFGSSTSTETYSNDEYVKDLLQFFELYGHKIKSLSLGNFISRKEFRDVITIHAPNLDYLNLSSLTAFRPYLSLRKVIWEWPLAVPLRIKNVRLGPCFSELCDTVAESAVLEILRNLDLKAIEDPNHYLYLIVPPQGDQPDNPNDNPCNLVPLVKDLEYKPTIASCPTFRLFSKMHPKLTRLIVNCDEMNQFSELYKIIVKYLNAILESSKDTLEHFEIGFNPHRFLRNIKMPSFKKLKSLKLIQTKPRFLYEGPHQQPPNPLEHDPRLDIFLFKKSKAGYVSWNYFPKLTQVCIDVQDYEVQGKLMGFFKYKSKSPLEAGLHRKEGIFAPSVRHLELSGNGQWPVYNTIKLMSKVFSNMTCIKIKCEHSVILSVSHSFWGLCPSAKYIEIYEVSNGIINSNEAAQLGVVVSKPRSGDRSINTSISSKMAAVDVDSFFTGFTRNLCYKLQITPFPELVERNDASIDFFRLNTACSSLKNLKILKIGFKKLSLPFATKVTGMYAFRKMPQTRIIFSYDVSSMTATDIKEMEQNLEPLAPYVELHQEKDKSTTLEYCCCNKWL